MNTKQRVTELLPGLLICLSLALTSLFLSGFIPLLGKTLLALLIGLSLHRWLYRGKNVVGIQFSGKLLLKWAVLCMGIRLSLSQLQTAGVDLIVLVLCAVLSVLILGFWLIRGRTHQGGSILFIAVGTAICGSAAIAATAPLVDHKKEDLGSSIAIVNLLGLLGVFCLPVLAPLLFEDPMEIGMWVGSTLQAVGHVAAAGDSLGTKTSDIAILTKMGRVSMLLPLILLLGLRSNPQGSFREKIRSLWYLWGFLGMIFLHPLPQLHWIGDLGSLLLVIAMVGIGLSINLQQAVRNSGTAIGYGLFFWLVQIVVCGLIIFLRN